METKGKEDIYSLLPTSKQMSSYFLGCRASTCIVVALENKHRKHKCPSPRLLSLTFDCWAWHCMVWNNPLGQFGSAVLAMSPPNLPHTLILLAFVGWGSEQQPWCCSSAAQPKYWCFINTFLDTNAKHITVWAAMRKVNSIPARPSTGCFFSHF